MIDANLKKKIFQHCHQEIDARIERAQAAMALARDAQQEETKSSAGDKYETGRAMMQLEQDKLASQLQQSLAIKKVLNTIDLDPTEAIIKVGSLIETTAGIYFLAIGLGELVVANQSYFVISIASPIGKLLTGKKVGDLMHFQNREIKVLEII